MRQGKLSMMVAIIAATLGLASLVTAQSAGAMTASGKIASVDAQQQQLRLKTGLFNTQAFLINADTQITRGEEAVELEELQPGAEATVQYEEQAGQHVAHSIKVEAGAAEAGSSGAAAPEEAPAAPPSAP